MPSIERFHAKYANLIFFLFLFFRLELVLEAAGKSLPTRVKYFSAFVKFLKYFTLEKPVSARIKDNEVALLLVRAEAQLKGMSKAMAIHTIEVLTY